MYYFSTNKRSTRITEKLLQALFPMGTYCVICGSLIDSHRPYSICDNCVKALNGGNIYIDLSEDEPGKMMPHLDSASSCLVYGLHSKKMVFDLKYNKRTYLSRPISMIMYDRIVRDEGLRSLVDSLDLVVPVPLHRSRLKKRGFNQAELISRDLTSRLNALRQGPKILHLPDGLVRQRITTSQRSVSGSERNLNLENAFTINPRRKTLIANSVILLVDDILTTGSTANHCAKALKDAGAGEVHFISLATGNFYLKGCERRRDDESFISRSPSSDHMPE